MKRINFYRGCLSQNLNRQNQSINTFFPYQNPLDSRQGATLNPHPLATFQEWMWFDADASFDNAPNCLDLGLWYWRRLAGGGYQGMYPWCGQNGQSTIETAP
jgi:hypothetical protein